MTNEKREYINEKIEIINWLNDNDWKINKIILGEWEVDDPRWSEYINERKIKRSRYDELTLLLNE